MSKTPREILDTATRTHVPENINLYPRMAAQLEKKTLMQTLRAKPVFLFLSILLALVLLSGVAYAVGHSLGFIPGVGIVDQSTPIRILAEPVSVKRDGITVTVTKFVTDSIHTFVAYRVDGIPPVTSGFPICTDPPSLKLSDGSILKFTGGGAGGMESYKGEPMSFETNYTFPPIPAQIKSVKFISPCQMPEIKLTLVPAPVDFATPAIEIEFTFESSGPNPLRTTTPTPSSHAEIGAQELCLSSLPATSLKSPNGSGLYLDKVIEVEKSYILVGGFTDAGDLPGFLVVSGVNEYQPKIEDANGQPVSFNKRSDIQFETKSDRESHWAYEIQKPVRLPLKITIDHVHIRKPDEIRFQVDVGENPQVGQKWDLALPIQLGGCNFIIDRVEMLKKGFLVSWHSGIDIPDSAFELFVLNVQPSTTDGGWGMEDAGMKDRINYAQNFLTDEPLPTGIITFELLQSQFVTLQGPWALTWTLPNP